MKIDIIGSKFTRKLTEFKNFRFEVNNIVEEQSILSLLSDPYEVTMKDINTTDLNDITIAYRDLNKLLYPNLASSKSEIIFVELLSELNNIVEHEHSFYNSSSFELLYDIPSVKTLSTIEKFRAIQSYLDAFVRLLKKYDKVILIKILPKEKEALDFVEGLYSLLEREIDHKLIFTVDNSVFGENFEAPLEVYEKVNQDLKKFSSDNYYTQLLFDEYLLDDNLSVYINYVEEREYVYELYKEGKPYLKSEPTTSRFYNYKLTEPGQYRIRIHVTDESVNPRFSQTYEYTPREYAKTNLTHFDFIELPPKENMWMLNVILHKYNFTGLIGNPYKFPHGCFGHRVFLPEEVHNDYYLKQEELYTYVLQAVYDMNEKEFSTFIENNDEMREKKPLIYEFLIYLRNKTELG